MGIGIEDIEQECLECGKNCINRRSLGNHVARSHKNLGGLEGYVLKHFLNGKRPLCKCGCGREVTWKKSVYRFNDYINGHNPAGFKVSQPKFSKEHIEKRNAAIRAAYNNPIQGKNIREKISKAVSTGIAHIDYNSYFTKKWQDSDFKQAQHQARVDSWAGEAGEIRREKVFTKEFGKKISEANMRRDLKRTSKAELEFVEHLKTLTTDEVTPGKWVNFSEGAKCFDAWIGAKNIFIEFDGIYWHGLDRDSDWLRQQINNMASDIYKNRRACSLGMTLYRISENSSWRSTTTLEELFEQAYHIVIKGDVIREGTPRLNDKTTIVSRNKLLFMNDEDKMQYVNALKNYLREYVAYFGWFYPEPDITLNVALKRLVKAIPVDKLFTTAVAGSTWLKSQSKAYWDVDNGPMKTFYNDKILQNVLKYRVGLNNSKLYEYKMPDGSIVSSKETFNVSLKEIRKGFIVQRHGVSWFKPVFAASIYRKFLGDIQNPKVWDPSIGFSARMLGFAAAYPAGTYYGTDPSLQAYSDACNVYQLLNKELIEFKAHLFNEGSEGFKINELFDLVFTCPPYFDKEKYVDEEGQCWTEYPTYETWINGYYYPTFVNAYQFLKSTGHLVLVIDINLEDITMSTAELAGFKLNDKIVLKHHKDHFARKASTNSRSHELLLDFIKK